MQRWHFCAECWRELEDQRNEYSQEACVRYIGFLRFLAGQGIVRRFCGNQSSRLVAGEDIPPCEDIPPGEIVAPGGPGEAGEARKGIYRAQARERMREGGREGGLSKGLHQVGDPSSQGKPHEWTDKRLGREAGVSGLEQSAYR